MRGPQANLVASAVALVVLVGMVTAAVVLSHPGTHFWLYETLGCLFTVPLAFAMWSGKLWDRGAKPTKGPSHWKEWLMLCLVCTAVSAVFLFIDVYVARGHPGIGAIFTIGAVAMSVVAIPSALRAWLLELLAKKAVGLGGDA